MPGRCCQIRAFEDQETAMPPICTPIPLLSGGLAVEALISGSSICDVDFATVTETSDAPYSTSTPYTIAVGDTFNGSLSNSSDRDVINLTVVAGETYTISVTDRNGSGLDTWLRIFTAAGSYVTQDFDSGTGTDSTITLTFATSGTYLIDVESEDGVSSGDYSVTVTTGTPMVTKTLDEIATQLTDGYWNSTAR